MLHDYSSEKTQALLGALQAQWYFKLNADNDNVEGRSSRAFLSCDSVIAQPVSPDKNRKRCKMPKDMSCLLQPVR